MIKKTKDLKPGDEIYWHGTQVMIEMVSLDRSGTIKIRHSLGSGWFSPDAEWLIDEPLDNIIEQAMLAVTNENLSR